MTEKSTPVQRLPWKLDWRANVVALVLGPKWRCCWLFSCPLWLRPVRQVTTGAPRFTTPGVTAADLFALENLTPMDPPSF